MVKIIYKKLSYFIVGICYKAHNELGRFRSEGTYGDFIAKELCDSKCPFKREVVIDPSFEGERKGRNIMDFVIDNRIVLEIKAKPIITKEDYFQTKRYLAASGFKMGIIVNFRQKYIYPKRVLHS